MSYKAGSMRRKVGHSSSSAPQQLTPEQEQALARYYASKRMEEEAVPLHVRQERARAEAIAKAENDEITRQWREMVARETAEAEAKEAAEAAARAERKADRKRAEAEAAEAAAALLGEEAQQKAAKFMLQTSRTKMSNKELATTLSEDVRDDDDDDF